MEGKIELSDKFGVGGSKLGILWHTPVIKGQWLNQCIFEMSNVKIIVFDLTLVLCALMKNQQNVHNCSEHEQCSVFSENDRCCASVYPKPWFLIKSLAVPQIMI